MCKRKHRRNLEDWVYANFLTDSQTFMNVLDMSPSSKGYIHGAVSELELKHQLEKCGYIVERIKEKPAGGFDEKKPGYKGDFLIHKPNGDYFVVECKGLKTNAEFRSAETNTSHTKELPSQKAINFLAKYINIDKQKIYNKGLKDYNKQKTAWESVNVSKTYPPFTWTLTNPGPDTVNLSDYFSSKQDIIDFVNNSNKYKLSEKAFRNKEGLYLVLQTHKPSKRKDPETNCEIAAPLKSDFSILAVDLYQRIGQHKFVFVNPDTISSSPKYPNHLYQNYIIDIIIPGIKNDLSINYPWFESIDECIGNTNPKKVAYDESQLDFRNIDDIISDAENDVEE